MGSILFFLILIIALAIMVGVYLIDTFEEEIRKIIKKKLKEKPDEKKK